MVGRNKGKQAYIKVSAVKDLEEKAAQHKQNCNKSHDNLRWEIDLVATTMSFCIGTEKNLPEI